MVEAGCHQHHAEFILKDTIRYLIIYKKTNQIIGLCAFPPTQAHRYIPQYGISYFIQRHYRGQNYATEWSHASTTLGLKVLHVQKIEIFIEVENKMI